MDQNQFTGKNLVNSNKRIAAFMIFFLIIGVIISVIFLDKFESKRPAFIRYPSPEIRYVINNDKNKDFIISLDLFDSTPLFMSTKWNYSSQILPMKSASNLNYFDEYNSKKNLIRDLKFNPLESNPLEINSLQEEALTDMRILPFLFSKKNMEYDDFKYESLIHITIIDGKKPSSSSNMILGYYMKEYVSKDESPIIAFLRNSKNIKPKVTMYRKSNSNTFNEFVIDWLEDNSHLAKLPEGLLKLTFYP